MIQKMKKELRLFTFFLLCFLPSFAILWAQATQVSGNVYDAITREALPFTNIIFSNTNIGTMSKMDGSFLLETSDTSYTAITISFVGYEAQTIGIKSNTKQNLTVNLVPESQNLKEIIIAGRKTAKRNKTANDLYRRVVAAKEQHHPKKLATYSFEEYSKTEFDLYNFNEQFTKLSILKPFDFVFEYADTTEDGRVYLPSLLIEKISDYYYTNRPKRKKEYIKGIQISGINNKNIAELSDPNNNKINIYDNVINISGKGFTSPFAKRALSSYKYFLSDSTFIDGDWCYKLSFAGHRKQDLVFTGFAWIHDETAAIKSVELNLLKQANVNYVNDFTIRQSFQQYNKGKWLKNAEQIIVELSLAKRKNVFCVRIVQHANRTNVKINEPLTDNCFEGDEVFTPQEAYNRPPEYWDTHRHEKLNDSEVEIYTMVDSVMRSPAYKRYEWTGHLLGTAYIRLGHFELGRLANFYSWNVIEGHRFRLGGKTNLRFSNKHFFDGYAAYGTRDKRWKYQFGFRKHLNRYNNHWHLLGAYYRYDLAQVDQANPLITHDKITTLFRFNLLDKLLLERRLHLFYEREWVNGFWNRLSLTRNTIYPQPGHYELLQPEADVLYYVDNLKTFELGLLTHWGYQQQYFEDGFYRYPLTQKFPIVDVEYRLGLKNVFQSDYEYHSLEFKIKQRIVNRLGYSTYAATVGKIWGLVPYPFLEMHDGNEAIGARATAFNLMKEFEFVSDQYTSVALEHHFDGLILNAVPLVNKLKLRTLLTGKLLYGTLSEQNKKVILLPQDMSALNDYYAEVGFGIENIASLLRADFLWRLTQLDKPDVAKWGVRIGVSPKF